MARRRFAEQPLSQLAVWARRIAFFALVATLLSILVVRSGILEIEPALATFAGALVLAGLAILLGLAAFIAIWRDGSAGLGYAVSAILIGLSINAYPGYLAYRWRTLPAIADITTDPIDPPRFEAIAKLRNRYTNPPQYAGLYAAEQQRNAYPDIEPLMLSVPMNAAYDAALAVVTKRKWQIMDAREPQANRREGRIEAVARSAIMGFREDVVLRVRLAGAETRIDVRSASRYGSFDLGSNASRIRSLVEDIDDVAGTPVKEKKPEKPAAKQPAAKGHQPTAKR